MFDAFIAEARTAAPWIAAGLIASFLADAVCRVLSWLAGSV